MKVNEYPGKIDHYRLCLKIIAEAAGAERPAIKSFLETGTLGEDMSRAVSGLELMNSRRTRS